MLIYNIYTCVMYVYMPFVVSKLMIVLYSWNLNHLVGVSIQRIREQSFKILLENIYTYIYTR